MTDNYDLAVFSKDRLLTLSDGIFAIAMTILALTLEPPKLPANPSEAQVWQGITGVLDNFVAFVASFLTLGMYWMGHHGLFRFIERADRALTWINMVFLMFVSLVPFTTGLYAGDQNSRIANTVFAANLIILGLLAYGMWVYACMLGHAAATIPSSVRKFTSRRILIAPIFATVGLIMALFQPPWAEYIFLAMVPVFIFSSKLVNAPVFAGHGNNS